MKGRTGFLLAVCALLAGCAGEPVSAPAQSCPPPATSTVSPEEEDLSHLPELPNALALEQLSPPDFGCFLQSFETQVSQYPLLEETELELTVTHLHGGEEGASLYVIGGLHGDELAGWYAGELLKKTTIQAGDVYILAPANAYGAEHEQRATQSDRDLNRNFPGNPEGVDAQQVANAIFEDIREKQPALVLDLHEARTHTDGKDNLGNSIICLDIGPVEELIFDLLSQISLASCSLDLFGSPPTGSVNRTVSEVLGIPVITLETSRDEPLPLRVRTQLRVAEFVLDWYGVR